MVVMIVLIFVVIIIARRGGIYHRTRNINRCTNDCAGGAHCGADHCTRRADRRAHQA